MSDLMERVTALESILSTVNLGYQSEYQDVPLWLAWRINRQLQSLRVGPYPEPWSSELDATLSSAVHLAAQAKLAQGAQGEALNQLTTAIIDDWCALVPRRFRPRPRWGSIVDQLGVLADGYPAGSVLREAAFELSRRVVDRAHELSQHAK
jgi:hypothetical protein